jgi:hypothetical protein
MQAIEFKTILQNGIVTIPAQYFHEWEGKTIRVILLEETEATTSSVKNTQEPAFQAITLSTQGFQFNRDEANDR